MPTLRLCTFIAFCHTYVVVIAAAVDSVNQPAMEMINTSCSRQPAVSSDAVRKRPDGLYNIAVSRDDSSFLNSFVNGQTYMVSVATVRPPPGHRITDFKLAVVRRYSLNENDVATGGTFHNIDGQQTAINAACPHVVTAGIGFGARSEVRVMWSAPIFDGDCVEFRATIVENEFLWYEDLTKTLCEQHDQVIENRNHSLQQPTECCACGTAKYLLTFRGLWPQRSRLSDSPTRHSSVHWSSVIGASHSKNYAMWNYGRTASRGVGDVCEYGDTNLIEDEMHQKSIDIRTVIKTPGMRRSGESHGVNDLQQRWAHFSTDRRHHLLSLLAQVGPSTDWCVGVTGLDLCLPNCSWASELVVELTPWDAGVSDGDQYIADRRKSSPAEPINRLNNTFPDDPTSPFFGTGVVLPMGLLRLRRLQPKSDDDVHQDCALPAPRVSNDLADTITDSAATSRSTENVVSCPSPTQWSDWTSCTVTCGPGTATRTRSVLQATTELCGEVGSHETKQCDGACIGSEDDGALGEDDCAMTVWSSWSHCQRRGSPCSASSSTSTSTGEPCTRRRHRTFVGGSVAEMSCIATTEEEERCLFSEQVLLPLPSVPATVVQPTHRCRHQVDAGPCDRRMTRWFHDRASDRCRSFQYSGCGGNGNRFDSEMECIRMCIRDQGVLVTTTSLVLNPATAFDGNTMSPTVSTVMSPSSATNVGNVQQVITAAATAAAPVAAAAAAATTTTTTGVYLPREITSLYDAGADGWVTGSSTTRTLARINCLISAWSTWSRCSATCGDGANRLRRRVVEAAPRNGGRNCSRRLEEIQSCSGLAPCTREALSRCRHGSWSSWSTCAKSCGTDSVQERVRRVTSTGGDESCTVKIARRMCALPPCSTSTASSDSSVF